MSTRTFGPTATAADVPRLSLQMRRVRDYMLGHREWRTVEEIARALEELHPGVRFPAQSVEAQLRHLRKAPHGSYHVPRRKRKGMNLSEYRVLPPKPVPVGDVELAGAKQEQLFPTHPIY